MCEDHNLDRRLGLQALKSTDEAPHHFARKCISSLLVLLCQAILSVLGRLRKKGHQKLNLHRDDGYPALVYLDSNFFRSLTGRGDGEWPLLANGCLLKADMRPQWLGDMCDSARIHRILRF